MRILNSILKTRASLAKASDASLLAAVADGEMKAFEEIHRRYFLKLTRFAIRIVDGQEVAEEVANDTLMTIWRTADRFEGRSKVSTWIFGIAYRKAMKTRQKAARYKNDVELEEHHLGSGDDVAETVIRKTDLAGALKSLTPDLRAVVELTYFNGYLYTEIAEIMECPVGTVKSRMSAARERLRDLLDDKNFLEVEKTNG